jgi:asparagine synthase (glutamine-hydrolysing)
MCGFAGVLDRAGVLVEPESTLGAMAATLARRGPDDESVAWLPEAGLGFAFRRLAIQDLSAAGRQPMTSMSGRYLIVLNGEIYNFRELRTALDTTRLRGTGDTEVFLELIDAIGLRAALDRAVGMFAFALWDRAERELILCRDRLGVKPLHVGATGETPFRLEDGLLGNRSLVFASELKAMRPVPGMHFPVDRAALGGFLRYSAVPGHRTIHPTIAKVPPGHLVRVREGRITIERYWSARACAMRPERESPSRGEALARTDELLRRSIARRMIADVPVGAFLSGGIDSSLVVALMHAAAPGRVRAFTLATDDARHDESARATAIARHLGVEHVILRASASDALALVPTLASIYDEPFADSSQIATLLIATLARRQVTVALTGDGGDEVFGGYERYRAIPRIARIASRMPAALRPAAGRALAMAAPMMARIGGARVHKIAPLFAERDGWAMYRRVLLTDPDADTLLLDTVPCPTTLDDPAWVLDDRAPLERRMMQADLVGYLVDDILVKVDRGTMAVGLEAREPLLDHELVEHALGLPIEFHGGGRTKPLLRTLLGQHLPNELVDGPKQGFSVPLDAWLRGPLRDWAESLLDPRRVRSGGLLRPEAVAALWSGFLGGKPWEHRVWNVLSFEAWREAWGGG